MSFEEKTAKMGIDGRDMSVYTDTENYIGGVRDMSEAQNRARAKYDAANTVQYHLKLNKHTDADILEKLEQSNNKQGLIKELIRRAIAISEA